MRGKEHTGEKVAEGMRKVSTFENVFFFCTIRFKLVYSYEISGSFCAVKYSGQRSKS